MSEEVRHVVVIGGSGGIGSRVASLFAERGWSVTATYHRHVPSPKDGICFHECDILSDASVEAFKDSLKRQPTVVINAAARPLTLGAFSSLPKEAFEDDHAFYVGGTVRIMRGLKSKTMLHVISTAAFDMPTFMLPYALAKQGELSLIKSLVSDRVYSDSRLLALSPGYVETGMLSAFPQKLLELERAKAGGSFLMPQDIASVIYTMVENEDAYPSGTHLALRTRADARIFLGDLPAE